MSVGELVNAGPEFESYRIFSSMCGVMVAEFNNRFDLLREYGHCLVCEWVAFGSLAGYASEYIEIMIQD